MIQRYRAWDTFDEDMVNDIFFSWQDCGYESLNECLSDERWKFMQSTGLFDNSTPKKEIFEGDIVHAYSEGARLIGVVEYFDNAYCIKDKNGIYNSLWINAEHYEVVGNIYQVFTDSFTIENTDAVSEVFHFGFKCTQEEAKKYPQFRWVALEEL